MREVQAFINSRPLMHPGHETPLTPAHLIFGRPLGELPPIKFNLNSKDDSLVEYTLLQLSLDEFWKAFNEEYLPQLRRHWLSPTEPPKLNELVIIADDNIPRYRWELAYIVKLATGRDGILRVAKVRLVRNGEVRTRAIAKLIPVERHLAGENVVVPTSAVEIAPATSAPWASEDGEQNVTTEPMTGESNCDVSNRETEDKEGDAPKQASVENRQAV